MANDNHLSGKKRKDNIVQEEQMKFGLGTGFSARMSTQDCLNSIFFNFVKIIQKFAVLVMFNLHLTDCQTHSLQTILLT